MKGSHSASDAWDEIGAITVHAARSEGLELTKLSTLIFSLNGSRLFRLHPAESQSRQGVYTRSVVVGW